MNNEEAIRELKEYVRYGDEEFDTPFDKAIRFAIKALSQEPCEDAVSRQAVLNEVRAIATWHSGDAFNEDRVIRHMKMLPSVLPKREQGGWISVKDRLPDKNTAVLTYVNTGMTTTYCLAHLNSLGEWKDWIGYELIEKERLYEVLAWMPLPEPIRRVRNKHGRH